MKILFSLCALLALPTPAVASQWNCAGLTQDQCARRIQKDQEKVVESMAAKNEEFCDGKDAGIRKDYLGRTIGLVSSDPSATLYCSGHDDAGWVMAVYDGDTENRFIYYPIGANHDNCKGREKTCAKEQSLARQEVLKSFPKFTALHNAALVGEENDPSGKYAIVNGFNSGTPSCGGNPGMLVDNENSDPNDKGTPISEAGAMRNRNQGDRNALMIPADREPASSRLETSSLGDKPNESVAGTILFTFSK